MVSYIARPALKSIPHFGKLNFSTLLAYTPNLGLWGGASVFIIFTFTEGIPIMRETFFKKTPLLGQVYVKNVDPEDLPN